MIRLKVVDNTGVIVSGIESHEEAEMTLIAIQNSDYQPNGALTIKEYNSYPEYILKKLRQREGLEEDDMSRDDEFSSMSPSTALEEVCNWEGLCGYAYTIKGWIEDIYGINIDEIANGGNK